MYQCSVRTIWIYIKFASQNLTFDFSLLWPGILLLLGLTLIGIVRCCISRFKSKVRYSSKVGTRFWGPSRQFKKYIPTALKTQGTNSLVASIARESSKTKSIKGAASHRGTQTSGNFGMGITRFNVARWYGSVSVLLVATNSTARGYAISLYKYLSMLISEFEKIFTVRISSEVAKSKKCYILLPFESNFSFINCNRTTC